MTYYIYFLWILYRYQFLAFDFGECVDTTKDNCRLLLVRLKMEGWIIGKSKVFLKYYNEEYLSRLYETQVRKIIKIQSMLRAFLACKKLNKAAQKTKMKRKYNYFIILQHYLSWYLNTEYRLIVKNYNAYHMRIHSHLLAIVESTLFLLETVRLSHSGTDSITRSPKIRNVVIREYIIKICL